MSQPPRNRQSPRPPQDRMAQQSRPRQQDRTRQRSGAPPQRVAYNRSVPQQRDPFPYIMGAVIGALVVGLMVVVYLIGQNTGGNPSVSNPPSNVPPSDQGAATVPPAGTEAGAAPRMTMDEFKALYDDPAKRPIILDVRQKQGYDEGHIKGAINVPEAEVDGRLAELPKDKLIVAYCA